MHTIGLHEICTVATRAAMMQFNFSATKQFVETLKSHAGEVDGMPRFLALFLTVFGSAPVV